MLLKKNYDREHLSAVAKQYPNLGINQLETTVFAFGLLQALIDSGLPFCFKGGTSLLLLLEHPKRLSTDIDIVVPKKTDFDAYSAASKTDIRFSKARNAGKEATLFAIFISVPKVALPAKIVS